MTEIAKTIPDRVVKCHKCRDRGFVWYLQKFDYGEYQYIAHCTCEKGAKWKYDGTQLEKGGSRYYIPCVDEVLT